MFDTVTHLSAAGGVLAFSFRGKMSSFLGPLVRKKGKTVFCLDVTQYCVDDRTDKSQFFSKSLFLFPSQVTDPEEKVEKR